MNLSRRFKKDPYVFISVGVLFLLLAVFVAYPVFAALKLSFVEAGSFSWQTYLSIFERSWLRRSFYNSLLLGCVTATISVMVGFLYAFISTRTSMRGKGFYKLIAILPIISPPFMLTLSVILLFGSNGFITRHLLGVDDFQVYGLHGLVFVQTLCFFPIAYLTLTGVIQGIDGSLEDAAMDLGAGRWKTFWTVTLPLSMPGVIAAWLLVFVTSLADFANPLILGGRFNVLSVDAYMQFTGGNIALGAALSNLLLLPCVAAFFLQKWYLKNRSFVTVSGKPQRGARDLVSPFGRALLGTVSMSIAFVIVLLYATVLAGCFTESWGIDYRLSLNNFAYVLERGWGTIVDTVLLSAIATPIAGILGMIAAYLIVRKRFVGRRVLEATTLFPFALPGTTVGIGYVLAFNDPPFMLTGTATIIVLAFIFRHMPVGIEAAKASLAQVDPAIEDAAVDLGASSPRVFAEIALPLNKPAFFAGMAYVFVHCMTAVSAVIFLVSAEWKHMTVLILDQVEILRFSAAAVLCLVLILIVLAAFGLLKLIVGRDPLSKGLR